MKMVFTQNRSRHSPQNINIVIVCCHERLFSIITIFTAVPVLVVVVVVVPVVVVVVVPVVVVAVKRAIFSWLLFLNVLKTQVRWLCLQRNTYGWILTPGCPEHQTQFGLYGKNVAGPDSNPCHQDSLLSPRLHAPASPLLA